MNARSQPPLDCGFTPQAQGHKEAKNEEKSLDGTQKRRGEEEENRKRKSKLSPLNPA